MYEDTVPGKFPCTESLEARVFSFENTPEIHGYSVQNDLIHHYSFAETLYLSIAGDLPSEEQYRLFELAITLLIAAPVTQDTVHAGVLSRVYNSQVSDLLSSVAPVCAERSRHTLAAHQDFIDWLSGESGAIPDIALGDSALCVELKKVLAKFGYTSKTFNHSLSKTAAIIALVFEAGLPHMWQIEFLFCWMSFVAPSAEGLARPPFELKNYPMRLPRFVDNKHE